MSVFERLVAAARRLSLWPVPLPDVRLGKAGRAAGASLPLKTLAEGTRAFPSICPLCACGCGLQVTVREGRVVAVEGDRAHPINEGALCPRVAALSAWPALPGRVTVPRIRKAGSDRWEELPWDAAFERAAELLRTARVPGGAAASPLRRSDGLAALVGASADNEEIYLFVKLARLLGVTALAHEADGGHPTAAAALAATFGHAGAPNGLLDVARARWCLLAGCDAAEEHPMAMRQVLLARAAGAPLLVVDARNSRTAAMADLHCRPRPGTDIAWLGALIRHVIEQRLYDEPFLMAHTDAPCRVHPDFGFGAGTFRGWDAAAGTCDRSTWAYGCDESGRPLRAAGLGEPDTVFSHLRRHFERYTFERAEEIAGIPRARLEQLARAIGEQRSGMVLAGPGLTGQASGVQAVRAAAILQLLLGNLGGPGGGLTLCPGEANEQGVADMGVSTELLPGRLPAPCADDRDLAAYAQRRGADARRGLVHLLKTWFGDAATAANDWGFDWLPRRDPARAAGSALLWPWMGQGGIQAALVLAANPAAAGGHTGAALAGLSRLSALIVLDPLETETAAFWRAPGVRPAEVPTEVIHLPIAWAFEKAGSLTTAARWIQWRPQAAAPPSGIPSGVEALDRLFRRLRARAVEGEKDEPIRRAAWDYGEPASAERVLEEIGGRHVVDGRPLDGTAELAKQGEGGTAIGCATYAGATGAGNRTARREPAEPAHAATRPGWAFAWPDDRRLLFDREAAPAGEVPIARLFAAGTLPDGPFPEHYEPPESPVVHALHPEAVVEPSAAARLRATGAPLAADSGRFPIVLVAGGTCEHAPNGATRHFPALAELVPAAFLEVSPTLGQKLALRTGELARVTSARGTIEVRVLVSPRVRSLSVAGREVEIVVLPRGWGFQGAARGPSAGTLLLPEPETRTCLVNVEKVTRRNL